MPLDQYESVKKLRDNQVASIWLVKLRQTAASYEMQAMAKHVCASENLELFRMQILALQKLSGRDNVTRIIDVYEDEEIVYLITDRVKYKTLL